MRDKIIVLDDEDNLRKILNEVLTRAGYEVFSFSSFDERAKACLNTESIDVVITDLQMPEVGGFEVLSYCKGYSPDLPVILITAFGTIDRAVSALKGGAFDFILKPFQNTELARVVEKAIQSRIRRKREPMDDWVSAAGLGPVPYPLFGESEAAKALRDQVALASQSRNHLWIVGADGTGKRSVAHEIHRKSDRARGPFVEVHVGAIPEMFQMTELFGVEKGATPIHFFSKPGSLELAQGGTLYIDDADALSVEVQNALFAALDDEYFSRVGGIKRFPMDLRIIATSTHSVESKGFHEELLYKFSSETISLHPLVDRTEDLRTHWVPYFIERACVRRGIPLLKVDPELINWFTQQAWKGNFGELEQKIGQMVERADGGSLTMLHLE